jgi:hypothetical protein
LSAWNDSLRVFVPEEWLGSSERSVKRTAPSCDLSGHATLLVARSYFSLTLSQNDPIQAEPVQFRRENCGEFVTKKPLTVQMNQSSLDSPDRYPFDPEAQKWFTPKNYEDFNQ